MGITMSRPGWRAALLTVALAAGWSCSSSSKDQPPPKPTPTWKAGDAVVLDVATWFPAGTVVRDAYTGNTGTVGATGSVTVTPGPSGVTLLEKVGAAPSAFDWKNAIVYFVITDRFQNGDTGNDHAYGRQGDGASEIGTWHGGDLAGLTAKLDYIAGLGATAVWISPFVEQVHGWVAGGSGDFKHYGYHGYYALDFTRVDANLGSEAELRTLVDTAHARGLRVLADVVINHPGYATGDDLLAYLPEVFGDGTGAAYQAWAASPGPPPVNWNGMYTFIDFQADGWKNWWANTSFTDPGAAGTYTWIRAGSKPAEFPGFRKPGTDELTKSVGFLPDFITEGTAEAGLPTLLARKAVRANDGTSAVYLPGATVRDYLVKWQSDWVRQMGFDGFRCDTAANVDLASWAALKTSATASFEYWKTTNPAKPIDAAAPFWTTAEAYGHAVSKDAYFTDGGFDSVLNFSFQPWLRDLIAAKGSVVAGLDDLDALYAGYAAKISPDPTFNVLSYLSSHDTRLFFGDILGYDAAMQRQAGTALLLLPGAVQIFYGDESGRRLGPGGSDPVQGTRSSMNWGSTDAGILAHWQKLGTFRKAHAAVGAGTHTRLTSIAGTYAFARAKGSGPSGDAVVVILTPAY